MQIRLARAEELDAFVELLEDVGGWLWARGVHQWEPGSMRKQAPRLERAIAGGEVHVIDHGGALAGGVVLDCHSNGNWEDLPADARYVHKFAVARPFAGRGLGRTLLERCEIHTRGLGVPRVRLDCWAGNTTLHAYYEAAGYERRGEVKEGSWDVMRFEKELTG